MGSTEVPDYPDVSLEHHLSSVSPTYNRMSYCVVGRISFDFRVDSDENPDSEEASPILSKIMLTPLVNPQSQSEPSAIEVYFHGRWRKACSFLKKRDIICVSNARVEQANDGDIHEWQLAFHDEKEKRGRFRKRVRTGSQQSQSDRISAMFVLTGDTSATRRPTAVVCSNRLDDGQIPLNYTGNGRGTNGSNSIPAELAAATNNKRLKARLANDRSYLYPTIASLHERAEGIQAANAYRSKGEIFHVYGVIIDARSPSICTGPDLRSYITIIDESSVGGTNAIAGFKPLEVYRFDVDPRNGTPFCVRGDVVRCHRLQLSRYDDKKGVRHVQGHAQCHSTFLLWAGDTEDDEPIVRMCPTRGPGKKPDAQHTLTENDRLRVNALRKFSRRYIAEEPMKLDNPWLKTVDEVVNAPFGAPFLATSFNLIGKFVHGPNDSMAGLGQVRFSMKDGREGKEDVIMEIESAMSHEHRSKCGQFTFESFVRSIRTHFEAKRDAKWILIQDVGLLARDAAKVSGKLTVGRHTSTVQWLPDYAAEVRALLSEDNNSAANMNDKMPTDGGENDTAVNNAVPAQPRANDRENSMNGVATGQTSAQALREVAEAVQAEKRAGQQAVKDAMASRWRIVGKHEGMHLPVSTIRQVVEAALRDDRTPKRVQAIVCSWVEPTDLRAATRRYCNACTDFVVGDGSACSVCGLSTTWAWRVRWTIADEEGCNIYAWIYHRDGEKFFGRPPRRLGIDSCKWVRRFAERLVADDVRLDCIVVPYACLWHSVKRPACVIVHTEVGFDEEKEGSDSDEIREDDQV